MEEAKTLKTRPSRLRKTLHDEMVETLRQMILDGDLAPGTRVPEQMICDQFDVSRTPLREALKVLAAEGLIILMPHRGAVVAMVEVGEVSAAFEVLGHLEILIGRLVVDRAGDDDLAMLMKMHLEMVALHDADERPAYFHLNQNIHLTLARLADNPILADTYEQLNRKIMRARSVANLDRLRWEESAREHAVFMEALMHRDRAVFPFLLRDHSERTKVSVVEQLHARDTEIERAG